MGRFDRSAIARPRLAAGMAAFLLAALGATGCNRAVDGDFRVLRHVPTPADTGWERMDPQRAEKVRTLLQRATNRDLASPDPAAAASNRRLGLFHDDSLVWQGAFLPPDCVVSDTDSYCVPRDDSDAEAFLREVFR